MCVCDGGGGFDIIYVNAQDWCGLVEVLSLLPAAPEVPWNAPVSYHYFSNRQFNFKYI